MPIQRFIFLEFTNPKVVKLLTELRATLEGRYRPSPIHITVRGPYQEAPNTGTLGELEEQIRGYGVVVGGAGTFQFEKQRIVYLKAQSPVFKHIWWKPDFPRSKFDMRPHITMFETESASSARAVERFLRAERLEISTFGLRLAVYAPKQISLFDSNTDSSLQRDRLDRITAKVGLIDRARRLRQSLLSEASRKGNVHG